VAGVSGTEEGDLNTRYQAADSGRRLVALARRRISKQRLDAEKRLPKVGAGTIFGERREARQPAEIAAAQPALEAACAADRLGMMALVNTASVLGAHGRDDEGKQNQPDRGGRCAGVAIHKWSWRPRMTENAIHALAATVGHGAEEGCRRREDACHGCRMPPSSARAGRCRDDVVKGRRSG
jgi:hypothetical protein